jgi:hypothetical protein
MESKLLVITVFGAESKAKKIARKSGYLSSIALITSVEP